MKKTVKANIYWTSVDKGGRKHILPIGMRYCPIIVFDEQPGDTLWSAEIYNTLVEGMKSFADLSYLVEDAPYYLLESGSKFLLYEGHNVVAEGVIV